MMVLRVAASATLAAFMAQSQPAPPVTPSTSPFAAAMIRKPAGHGTPVALTFAWPAGTVATIHSERTKTTVTPDGRKTQTGALRYRMRVSAHKDGRLIEYDNFEPVGVALEAAEQPALDQMLNSLMPSLIVRPTGEFVRLGDLTKIRAAIRQLLAEAKKQAGPGALPPNLEAVLANLTSDTVLTQLAAAEWHALVGAYVGFTGKVGEMTQYDSEEPLPVIPGLMVPMRTSFGARQLGSCQAGQSPGGCVTMQIRSVVAPGAMQPILKRLMDGVKQLADVTYENFDVITEVSTTLEPSTMRPYQLTRTKTAEFTMRMPGQPRVNASLIERRTYRITYD
jgi:hypothetical protein